MNKQEQLDKVKEMIDALEMLKDARPSRPLHPRQQDGQSHAEFGALTDEWEVLVAAYRTQSKEHREQEWVMESEIEELIKQYTGLSNHPKCDDIWLYINDNFDGMGYMELLNHAEELLDIFGIE